MSVYSRDDLPRALEEQPVAELHDVGLVDRRDALRGPIRRACSNANCAIRVDAFSVMIFRLSTTPGTIWCSRPAYRSSVFSRTMTRSTSENRLVDAGQIPNRPQVGVEIQRLAQPDVHAGEPLRDRRRHRSLERDLVPPDRVEQRAGQRLVVPLEGRHARVVPLPLDVDLARP